MSTVTRLYAVVGKLRQTNGANRPDSYDVIADRLTFDQASSLRDKLVAGLVYSGMYVGYRVRISKQRVSSSKGNVN